MMLNNFNENECVLVKNNIFRHGTMKKHDVYAIDELYSVQGF